jgi:hypothetical protein
MQSGFLWGSNGKVVTPEEVARQRRMAEALLQANAQTPQNLGEGLNAIGRALAYNSLSGRAADAEKTGRDAYTQQFDALGDSPTRQQLMQLEDNGFGTQGQQSVVDTMLGNELKPKDPLEINNQLVDPRTFKVLGDYRSPDDITGKGGGADAEKFSLNPTYYKIGGKVLFGQLGDQGTFRETPLPDGAEPAIPVQQLNQQTDFTGVDKYGRPTGSSIPINNADAAHDTAVGKGMGEKEVALPEVQAADFGALNSLDRQVGVVTQNVDKAIAQIDANPGWNTGFVGDLASALKGTPQYDLAQTLQTIKANVGFDQLQQMRDNSKTGGALGSISDAENALLQAVNGALTQGQTAGQLKENLQLIRQLQAQVVVEKKAAYTKKYGGGDEPGSAAATEPAGEPVPGFDGTFIEELPD